MRRLLSSCLVLLLGLTAAAEDRVSWEITPRVTAPGQPFRLQIIIESDVILGGAQQAGREIRPPRGMALRLSGQIARADSNEATINYSGVAPEQEGEHVIPTFNLRFARKLIAVPEIKLIVSKAVSYRREAQARAELVIPDRTFYVGELIRGAIRMRGGVDEDVVASFGLESVAEGFTFAVSGDRQPLPAELGQGLQTTFALTPIREGVSELALNGTMLIQGPAPGAFGSANGRDRPFAFRRKITVEHVPMRGRPADWSGAIGTFVAEAVQVSKDKPEVGEPIRLRAILTGSGNLDRLLTPELPAGEQWDVLPAQERRRSAEEQRFFVYTLVPRLPGKLLTPPIRFSTFDPLTKQYGRIEFKPIEVTVTGNAPAKVDLVTSDPAAPVDAKKPKPVTGLAAPEPRRVSLFGFGQPITPLAASPAFWSGNGLLAVLLLALAGLAAYFGYLAAHPEIRRRRHARGIVRAALTTASPAAGDRRAFARTVVDALQVGAAALLDAEAAAMTQSDVERALPGASRALLDDLFVRATGERFAAHVETDGEVDDPAALELLRRLLSLL
jgi:hypothetical protein